MFSPLGPAVRDGLVLAPGVLSMAFRARRRRGPGPQLRAAVSEASGCNPSARAALSREAVPRSFPRTPGGGGVRVVDHAAPVTVDRHGAHWPLQPEPTTRTREWHGTQALTWGAGGTVHPRTLRRRWRQPRVRHQWRRTGSRGSPASARRRKPFALCTPSTRAAAVARKPGNATMARAAVEGRRST